MTVIIYRDEVAFSVFVSHGTIGTWPYNCLKALGYPSNNSVGIQNIAKQYPDGSDFFEIINIHYSEFVDENGQAHGSDILETVDNLNALFVGDSAPLGIPPVITSDLSISITDGETVNYLLESDGGVGYEYSTFPAGLGLASNNPRNIIGNIAGGVGIYPITMYAINYHGTDTETLTITVTASFSNTRSISFKNNEYLESTATTSNPLYRASNGSGSGDAWSTSSWIRIRNTNSEQAIFMFGGDDQSNDGRVYLYYDGNDESVTLFYGTDNDFIELKTPSGSVVKSDSIWSNIIVTYDGGTTGSDSGSISSYYGRFEIWVNGVSQALTESNGNFGFSGEIVDDHFRMGRNGSNGNYIKSGLIDEFAIWGSDQTANVAAIYNSGIPHDLSALGTAPDHWWRMGDGDTFPIIEDNIASVDFTMTNMTASSIINDVP